MENTFDSIYFDFGVDILLSQIPFEETSVQQHEETDYSISDFLNQNKAKETMYNNTSHMNRLMSFLKEEIDQTESRSIWEIDGPTLDQIMSQIFMRGIKEKKAIID